MIRLDKVRTVAAFEFMAAVKRPAFLVFTFGMPLFMAAYGGIVAVPSYYAEKHESEQTRIYGVVDRAGVTELQGDTASTPPEDPGAENARKVLQATGRSGNAEGLARSHLIFRPFATDAEARAALVSQSILGYYVVMPDYLRSGAVEVYTPDTGNVTGSGARGAFEVMLRRQLLRGHVPPDLGARIDAPMPDPRRFVVSAAGAVKEDNEASSAVRIVLPVAFMVLFLMSILMTSGYLLQGTATEKENKVVDVLLASANPDEILGGKLLGLGAAGLLQVGVWLAMLFATGFGVLPFLFAAQVELPWRTLVLALPFFILAFLFFGSLMLGTGSLGSNMREAQQLAMMWSITAALPLMLMGALIRAPHGFTARLMTWIPLTAGPVIIMRSSMDPEFLAWWEILGPMLVLVAVTWLALRMGATLFRIGLLHVGSRPSFREVMRQARLTD